MEIEAVIAALDDSNFTEAESAIIEGMLREHHVNVPEQRLLNEIALSLAIHRREK